MRGVLALLLASGLLAGCSAQAAPSTDGRVRVAAAFYPLAWVSSQVAPHAEITDLTRPGVEPHDIELTFAQTVALARADVVVHEQGFQAAVDEGVANDAEGTVVDAGAVAGLRPFADDPGQTDPHFWQDPLKLAAVGDAVAAALAKSDAAHRASYLANAVRLRRELTALDRDYRRGLADCRLHTIVSSHDAFGYLSKYGVHVASIAGLSPDAEPTPAVLSGLHDLIRREQITTVFSERLVSPKIADTLAHDVGVRSRVLDPIEGLSSQTTHDTYLTLMRANLLALEEANRCYPSS